MYTGRERNVPYASIALVSLNESSHLIWILDSKDLSDDRTAYVEDNLIS